MRPKRRHRGRNLVALLFTTWLGADSDLIVKIEAAYRVGTRNASYKFPRDVLVEFSCLSVKTRIFECF